MSFCAPVGLPQAIRLVIPTLVTQLVALLKDSTLGYVVSYPELMKQAQNLTVYTHLLVQTYLIVAAVYVALTVDHIDLGAAQDIPSGPTSAVVVPGDAISPVRR